MAEQYGTPVSAYGEPPKKDNKTLIIIIVVLIVLCCCCTVLGGATWWLWNNGDALLEGVNQFLPSLI